MVFSLFHQWTVSGPDGPSGVHVQPAVVQEDRPPPDSSCNLPSMEGPRVRALTTAPETAWPLTVVSKMTGFDGEATVQMHHSVLGKTGKEKTFQTTLV